MWTAVRIVVFFQVTCIGWLLFRGETVANLLRIVRPWHRSDIAHGKLLVTPDMIVQLFVIGMVLFVAQLVKYLSRDHEIIFRIPAPVRALVYAGLILGMLVYGEFGGGKFIYFQF